MSKSQIKIAASKGAGYGIAIHQHDQNGGDAGEVVDLAPGKSKTLTIDEDHSIVVLRGAAAEVKGEEAPASLIVEVTVEKDSTHDVVAKLTDGANVLAERTVNATAPVNFTIEGEPRLVLKRGGRADA